VKWVDETADRTVLALVVRWADWTELEKAVHWAVDWAGEFFE
jgi:hypothetical protein